MSADERLASIAAISQDFDLTAEEKIAKINALVSGPSEAPSAKADHANGTGKMSVQDRLALITNNLQEVLNPEIMEDVLKKDERPLSIYWGTAPTGRPHCGYFVPMIQIASFLRAGCNVKILLADIHAFLDNLKAPIELVKFRASYYKFVITELLKAIGVSVDRLEFVLGSSHQLSEKYQMDLLRLCTIVTMHDAKKAGAEVVKQVENATLSGLIYPLMQALDEEYLGVDAQFGGVDQRKIFTLAKEVLPKLGYKERAHLMNPMVPGLAGGKMSASDPESKVDVLEKPEAVAKKLKKAFALPKETENNGILSFVEYVLLPASALKHGQTKFVVERMEGEPLVYESISQMQEDYRNDILTPQLLKLAVIKHLNELLATVQAAFEASQEWQDYEQKAYPPVVDEKKEKKEKKKKDKGTKAPIAKLEAQPDGTVEGSGKDQVNLAANATQAIKELEIEKKVVQG